MTLFKREYECAVPEFLQDLDTLEREGAVYAQLWQEGAQSHLPGHVLTAPCEEKAIVFNRFHLPALK